MKSTYWQPKISVVMPVYNGEEYLRPAIESILQQTFIDFEFLIINDGSVDESEKIIRSYKDRRIKLLNNPKNMGLVFSLNKGIESARGEYIVRMDSDDIACQNRFEKQNVFLDKNPEFIVCGSWYKTIGKHAGYIKKFPTDPRDLKAHLLFYSPLAHPSVIIRRSVFNKKHLRYNEKDKHFEDYGLWVKIAKLGLLTNIPQVLLFYRVHDESISRVYSNEQKKGAADIQKSQLQTLEISPTLEEMRMHVSLKPDEDENLNSFINKQQQWFKKIMRANEIKQIYNDKALKKVIYLRWYAICGANTKEGIDVWKQFVRSSIFQMKPYQLWGGIKIFIKCLLRK